MAEWEEHDGCGCFGDDFGGRLRLNGGGDGVEDPQEKNAWS